MSGDAFGQPDLQREMALASRSEPAGSTARAPETPRCAVAGASRYVTPRFDGVDQPGIGRFMMPCSPPESERSIVDP